MQRSARGHCSQTTQRPNGHGASVLQHRLQCHPRSGGHLMRNATGHINVARSIFDHPMFDDDRPYSPRGVALADFKRGMAAHASDGPQRAITAIAQLGARATHLFAVFHAKGLALDLGQDGKDIFSSSQKRENVGPAIGPASNRHYYLQLRCFSSLAALLRGQQTGRQWASNGPAMGQKKKTL